MEHKAAEVLLQLSFLGIDLSITSAVMVIWLAALIVFTVAYAASRKAVLVPGKLQSLVEIIYEFWESQTSEILGGQTRRWLPLIFSIFSFILISNFLGMIPEVYAVTSNINVTAAIAIIVFFSYHTAGIKEHGFKKYIGTLVPSGVPVYIAPFLFIIEIISHLVRPFSLAIRLFANITAGHTVAFTFLSLIFILKSFYLVGFPFLGRIVIGLFEVFVAFIQAYVFAYLASLYIGLAVKEH